MGFPVNGSVRILRLLQLPASIVFLIAISWVEYVSHLGSGHILSTALRFLAGLLTMFYTAHQLHFHFRGHDLMDKGTGYKVIRLAAETVVTVLWYLSLILGKQDNNTTLGNTDDAILTPAIMSEACWFAEVVLFTVSWVVVVVQTLRRDGMYDDEELSCGFCPACTWWMCIV